MIKKQYANQARLRRHQRVRKKVAGSTLRPRLSVFRSGNQIYAQVIDDASNRTLAAASSRDAEMGTILQSTATTKEDESLPDSLKGIVSNRRVQQARAVGQLIAKRARAMGIERVVFDRGGYIYHGRVAALAFGAREAGLDF